MKNIILIGAGGHARSCLDVINSTKKYKILGFVDKKKNLLIYNYRVLGDDKYLENLNRKINLHISFGFIKSPQKRIQLYNNFKNKFNFPVLISSFAKVSKQAKVLDGTIVHHFVLINSGAKIGYNCIINSGAIVEHGVRIGNNCNIATKVVINGDVEIKNNTFIGSGTIIKEGVTIGNNCIIGMGKIIKKDIQDNSCVK